MHVKLYDWAPSPFSLKVRAILDYKGIAYERAPILKFSNWQALHRRGKVGKAPALDIDGEMIVDSTNIAYELERRVPTPRIVPDDPRERALCHALEEWADESLYFCGLYFHWHDPEGVAATPQVFSTSLFGRGMYYFYRRRILRQLDGQGTSRKAPAHVLDDLRRHLQAIEKLSRDAAFVIGGVPYLCDFAMLGQLAYLGRTPVGGRELQRYPAVNDYITRMKSVRLPGRGTQKATDMGPIDDNGSALSTQA